MSAPNRGGARRQLEHDGHHLAKTTVNVERVQGGEAKAGEIEHSPHRLASSGAFA